MRILRAAAAYLAALIVLCWRKTCRYEVLDDPRPELRKAGTPRLYALLHAHQIAAVFINDDGKIAAMVSRSADGDLLVPSLRLRGVVAVRGSTRKAGKDKGGQQALEQMGEYVAKGVPGLLAVDGPRGPRGTVHRGVAELSLKMGAVITPVAVVCSKCWILKKTWDRMQIPKPFSKIRLCFGKTLVPGDFADVETLREAVRQSLLELEQQYDPKEANR